MPLRKQLSIPVIVTDDQEGNNFESPRSVISHPEYPTAPEDLPEIVEFQEDDDEVSQDAENEDEPGKGNKPPSPRRAPTPLTFFTTVGIARWMARASAIS